MYQAGHILMVLQLGALVAFPEDPEDFHPHRVAYNRLALQFPRT